MKELALHARQKRLLSILNISHGIETGKALAEKVGASERTVRSDIREINEQLKPYDIRIVPLHGKGYTLSIPDRALFLKLLSKQETYLTREDRLRALMFYLLRENEWAQLGHLEDEMYISRTTLEGDLKAIRKRISSRHPYLKMQRQGSAVKLEADEKKRRDLLIRLYAENWDYDSRDGIVLKEDEFGKEILEEIRAVVKKYLQGYAFNLDDFSLIYLTLAIAVMYYRIQDGNALSCEAEESRKDQAGDAARDILNELGELWKLTFEEGEYCWFSDILRKIQVLNNHTYNKNQILECTDVQCHQIVNQVLKSIEDDYGMDFTSDDRLFVDMVIHVQALFCGIVAVQMQNHMLGDELRKRYPFLGEIAHGMRLQLARLCGMDLDSGEEDYLLPFLISAQRTSYRRKRGKGIRAVVISHLNASLTHYLIEQLLRRYGKVLDLNGPLPVYAREYSEGLDPQLLITTVRLQDFKNIFQVPVVTVSALLEESDCNRIDEQLTLIRNRLLYPGLPVNAEHYFKESQMYGLDNGESMQTAVRRIQQRMYEDMDEIDARLLDLNRDYYSIRRNGLVFFCQTDERVDESRAALVYLKNRIYWNYTRNVEYVFYLVLTPKERRYLGWFYYLADVFAEHPDRLRENIEKKKLNPIEL